MKIEFKMGDMVAISSEYKKGFYDNMYGYIISSDDGDDYLVSLIRDNASFELNREWIPTDKLEKKW